MFSFSEGQKRLLRSISLVSVLCLFLVVLRVPVTGSTYFVFISENLALAWLGPITGFLLIKQLKVRRWLSWQNLSLSALWLFLLPNSWYVVTDFVHIWPNINQLYDIVMIISLVLAGFSLGFASLYSIHKEFLKRQTALWSHAAVVVILLLSSFAIYLGRDLRWNSWDIVTNPSGVILTVSDQVVDPLAHPQGINITALFFVLLGTLYLAIWLAIEPTKKPSS